MPFLHQRVSLSSLSTWCARACSESESQLGGHATLREGSDRTEEGWDELMETMTSAEPVVDMGS